MYNFFKLVPVNAADYAQLKTILENKIFYPEITSTPPRPVQYDDEFDYRQFFIYQGAFEDGFLVYTRDQLTSQQDFYDDYIPELDFTGRYYLSAVPTVEPLVINPHYRNSRDTNPDRNQFLSYTYILPFPEP